MHAAGELAQCRLAFLRRNVELVVPEMIGAFAAQRNTEHLEARRVETPARFDVLHDELHVIDEAAAIQTLRFHGATSSPASRS